MVTCKELLGPGGGQEVVAEVVAGSRDDSVARLS